LLRKRGTKGRSTVHARVKNEERKGRKPWNYASSGVGETFNLVKGKPGDKKPGVWGGKKK